MRIETTTIVVMRNEITTALLREQDGFSAGCLYLWIRSAEPPYEDKKNILREQYFNP